MQMNSDCNYCLFVKFHMITEMKKDAGVNIITLVTKERQFYYLILHFRILLSDFLLNFFSFIKVFAWKESYLNGSKMVVFQYYTTIYPWSLL